MAGAKITQKIVIHGRLELQAPLLIGAGGAVSEQRNEVDVYVLKDKKERPFIPGTSLTGVLRAWMESFDFEAAGLLFGRMEHGRKSNRVQELQSALDISDIVLDQRVAITLRDGVGIDAFTGTGIKGCKYDYEAVERGASGDLHILITLREYHDAERPDIIECIKRLTDRLHSGIRIGALTSKGFGLAGSHDVMAEFYDFRRPEDVERWMLQQPAANIYKGQELKSDTSHCFSVDADFVLCHSLIVRDRNVSAEDKKQKIHAMQMKSGQDYLLPGTTLKGVLRHRAGYILRMLDKPDSELWLRNLMGFSSKEKSQKSRFVVDETYFHSGVVEKVQSRNRIDRFTGGTIESALFTNKPVWQKTKDKPTLHLHFEIQDYAPWEAGLALFLLKDLWTGNLAIGGEKSIGRGTLQGIAADIVCDKGTCRLEGRGQVVQENAIKGHAIKGHVDLQAFAQALLEEQKGGSQA